MRSSHGSRQIKTRRPVLAVAGLLLVITPLLAACDGGGFRPMYGAAGIGAQANEKFAQVDIVPIPGRVGQVIRNELIFQTTGGGAAVTPVYRLEIAIRESVSSTLVRSDGHSDSQVYNLEAAYRLIRVSDNEVALTGKSYGRAGFERFTSIFSNVRAREDAENRAARSISEDLRSRLSAYLAGTPA